MNLHQKFMNAALKLATKAATKGEVPVGAVIVDSNNKIIGIGYNKKEKFGHPFAHAEIIAIKKACKKQKNWRLNDCTLYTTLEPCLMCVGAILQARIGHIVFAVKDPKFGCVVSLYNLTEDKRFNHRSKYTYEFNIESQKILQNFFMQLRN